MSYWNIREIFIKSRNKRAGLWAQIHYKEEVREVEESGYQFPRATTVKDELQSALETFWVRLIEQCWWGRVGGGVDRGGALLTQETQFIMTLFHASLAKHKWPREWAQLEIFFSWQSSIFQYSTRPFLTFILSSPCRDPVINPLWSLNFWND